MNAACSRRLRGHSDHSQMVVSSHRQPWWCRAGGGGGVVSTHRCRWQHWWREGEVGVEWWRAATARRCRLQRWWCFLQEMHVHPRARKGKVYDLFLPQIPSNVALLQTYLFRIKLLNVPIMHV